MLIHCNKPMNYLPIPSMSVTINVCFVTRDPEQEYLNPLIIFFSMSMCPKLIPFYNTIYSRKNVSVLNHFYKNLLSNKNYLLIILQCFKNKPYSKNAFGCDTLTILKHFLLCPRCFEPSVQRCQRNIFQG